MESSYVAAAAHSIIPFTPPPPISNIITRTTSGRCSSNPYPYRRLILFQNRPCRSDVAVAAAASSYNEFDFRDFQDYVKPARLLPSSEVKAWTNASQEDILSQAGVTQSSQSLYKIRLFTSRMYGSGLSELDAAVLVCIIGEHGDSILQRLPSVSYQGNDASCAADVLHFQSGSLDEFSFQGPQLGRVRALWVGVESGKWRLGGSNLVIVSRSESTDGEFNENEDHFASVQYDFEAQDLLLGEGSDMMMAELRPSRVIKYSGNDPISLLQEEQTKKLALVETGTTNEESMKDYAILKLSLLVYDATLVLAGTSTASFVAGEDAAFAFLTGGVGGFVYLVLLQRYVDRLSTPEVQTVNGGGSPPGLFAGVNGPVLALAVSSVIAAFVAKHGAIDVFTALTPKDIVSGLIGFLACKVAVVLAAFKPMSIGSKDST